MPRRSRVQLTKDHARAIARKLQAVDISAKRSAHQEYGVFYDGILVASFGVRRGSRRNQGHDHLPGDLDISMRFAKDLANCPRSREDYLRAIGAIEEGVQEDENEQAAE